MDKQRHQSGNTNYVMAAVAADTVIEIGDLLWIDGDEAKPFSMAPANEYKFAQRFLGVAMHRSRSGETSPICVATTGVFEFECSRDTFGLGDLVGPADQDGFLWANQRVRHECGMPIGRVAKSEPTPSETVRVKIQSAVMCGPIC